MMAKRAGMKVDEFGFGFPPRLWGHKPENSETTYSINAIPFGGFVKIQGENETEIHAPGTFGGGTFWQKFSVIVAGVVMNFLLGAVLLSIIYMSGTRHVEIAHVAPDSPAAQAGFKAGDQIPDFKTIEKVQRYVSAHKGEQITLAGKALVPRKDPPAGEGALGVSFKPMALPWYRAIIAGFGYSFNAVWQITKNFGTIIHNLLTTGHPGADLAGPVGIAVIAGEAARTGFTTLLQFIAFISLNLAVINLVPFPALDGGRLLFLIIEKIKGSPIPKRFEQTVNSVGFVLLLMLMVYITVKDVVKFF